MSSVSIPKNSYMLWLKDNRENIKQMYFSNYTLKTDSNGKKENFQTILAKKAGEIWKSLGQEDKQSYANKLKELKELKEEEDEDMNKIDIYTSMPKRPKTSFLYFCDEHRENISKSNPNFSIRKVMTELGKDWSQLDNKYIYEKMSLEAKIDYEEKMDEYNINKYVNQSVNEHISKTEVKQKIYCPNNCGVFRKTLDGMYSHLGLKENGADNCTKKQNILKNKKELYKKALEKLYEYGEEIDISKYTKKSYSLHPPYEEKSKRKTIPKAVKNSVWNTYIESNDPNKLIGKCFVGCGCEITIANFELGHVKAYSKGGSDKVNNLRPICSTCNKSMGTMNLLEFKEKYGLDVKQEKVLNEEQLTKKINELELKIINVNKDTDTLNLLKENETLDLDKCESFKSYINESISLDKNKLDSKNINIKEEIDKLMIQINQLKITLKEEIYTINDSIKDKKIQLKDNNTKLMSHKHQIDSFNSKISINDNSIKNISIEKEKFEEQLNLINKKKEEEHNIMVKKIEEEIKAELKQEQLRKQIKERLIQEQKTQQGDLINLI